MNASLEQMKKNRAFLCLECGKCTAVCPISKVNLAYSPRRMLAAGLFYGAEDLVSDQLLWSCLTCQLCSQRCPVDVRFSEYMRDVRVYAYSRGSWGNPSHGGAMHHIMEMAASPKLKQNRTEWISDDLKVRQRGEVVYFVGCLPYYQELFGKDFDFSPLSIAVDTVKILNHIGIEPVVLENERCCGHDLYWLGQVERFAQIAKLNLDEIRRSGAEKVITACPECAVALKTLYPEVAGDNGLEVKHISEVVLENRHRMKLGDRPAEVTYQDPCRLGRYLEIYEQPRQTLASVPGVSLREMPHNRRGATCCGTTNWMNCDAGCKRIQHARLEEARATGAETLVTACPKCQIHFRCAECGGESQQVGIKIADYVNVIASALEA
ncbi:MAG: (Fe-S)-binding protein [Candidatus Zixiibacteriota bacterium]|nr:MAG: (Fe-S)-binding protein [candidate division Zixibacteria bacterium]